MWVGLSPGSSSGREKLKRVGSVLRVGEKVEHGVGGGLFEVLGLRFGVGGCLRWLRGLPFRSRNSLYNLDEPQKGFKCVGVLREISWGMVVASSS